MGLSTSQLREAWAPPCNAGGFVTIALHGAGRVTVDPRCVDAVQRLNECLVDWDYRTRSGDTGAYNCRQITGGSGYSLHAYGIALDINWQTNPYGPTLITDMPRGMVDEITALRTNNGKRVWEWGGSWSGNKDAMHYEIDCSPADLATGIAGVVTPPEEEHHEPIGVPDMFIVIEDVALCSLMGNVLTTYPTPESYAESYTTSAGVPTITYGPACPREMRDHIYEQLLRQHVVAVGAEP